MERMENDTLTRRGRRKTRIRWINRITMYCILERVGMNWREGSLIEEDRAASSGIKTYGCRLTHE